MPSSFRAVPATAAPPRPGARAGPGGTVIRAAPGPCGGSRCPPICPRGPGEGDPDPVGGRVGGVGARLRAARARRDVEGRQAEVLGHAGFVPQAPDGRQRVRFPPSRPCRLLPADPPRQGRPLRCPFRCRISHTLSPGRYIQPAEGVAGYGVLSRETSVFRTPVRRCGAGPPCSLRWAAGRRRVGPARQDGGTAGLRRRPVRVAGPGGAASGLRDFRDPENGGSAAGRPRDVRG